MTAPFVFASVAIVLSFLAPEGRAQTQDKPADPVIRVAVDLVQVDAVVTDAQGRHVENLKAGDFEVLEDGKPQPITAFSEIKAPPAASHAPETAADPLKPLRPADVRRTILLLADNSGMEPLNIAPVRKAMRTFVDEQMQPGDLVAVMTTGGGAGVFQQFTNDKRRLQASIDRIVWYPGSIRPAMVIDAVARGSRSGGDIGPGDALSVPPDVIAAGFLGTLNYAIAGLGQLPGRKMIALFSDGFQVVQRDTPTLLLRELQQTVERANRAAVVIHTIDSRGLHFFKEFDSNGTQFFRHTAQFESNDLLAKGTGGLFFRENNGLADELKTALADMSSYYLIGYRPHREYFDLQGGRPQFHSIKVRLKRAGLTVRTRNGFTGVPDPPARPPVKDRHEQLRAALFSPFGAGGIPVQLTAFFAPASMPGPTAKRTPAIVNAMLAIDARSLKFQDIPGPKKRIVLDAITAAYGADSELISSSDKTFTLDLTPEEASRVVTTGLVYGMEMEIATPGAYQIRAVVRDAAADTLGSASAFVQLPDFDKQNLALTSIRLSDPDPQRNTPLALKGVVGPGSEVTRVFAPGAVLHYSFGIYGVHPDKGSGRRDVDIEVCLFRGSQKFFSGPRITLSAAKGKMVPAEGQIKLPAEIPSGDYEAEILVYDHLAGPRETPADAWVDFSIF